ncbi:MAG: class II aldolase/adducin family protein [Caldicoprobacterales bacterium]|jgi:ribulose-5-phosphate 4-epimerase/fuculose-1-phosphate aldolase|nr:class II aldolase [Clostridiales bacterium]
MFQEALKELQYISTQVGLPIEYTQGGGGNTSVKLNEELMAVKASGFKLKQINPKEGYVVVNYKNIMEFYNNVDLSLDRDYEKESTEFAKANVVEMEGLKKLRPSVEAGFHSILLKYVIHTHPVYANIVCCTHKGRELMNEIFKNVDFGFVWIPYINPGFSLTLRIKKAVHDYLNENDKFPQVIFMENHGLITTADNPRECLDLHQRVNDMIKTHFGIAETYPKIELDKLDENKYVSRTEYLKIYLKANKIGLDFFDRNVLYPDQLVYLNENISLGGMDNKLNINTETGEIIYLTNESEAQTMEETLLACIYVIDNINRLGLPLKSMTAEEIDFIKNWESEAYRKSLVKSLKK